MTIITVGREQDNTIVVSDNYVGRHHLQLIQDDRGNYLAVDLNSANGTYVNGNKIAGQVPLNPNDIIRIGNTTLPWKSYFTVKSSTPTAPILPVAPPVECIKPTVKAEESKKEKKPINWRNIISAITAIISLLLMLAMLFRSLTK
jgi:hypothetical protein